MKYKLKTKKEISPQIMREGDYFEQNGFVWMVLKGGNTEHGHIEDHFNDGNIFHAVCLETNYVNYFTQGERYKKLKLETEPVFTYE